MQTPQEGCDAQASHLKVLDAHVASFALAQLLRDLALLMLSKVHVRLIDYES